MRDVLAKLKEISESGYESSDVIQAIKTVENFGAKSKAVGGIKYSTRPKTADKEYYADIEDGTWGVYGDPSGFCYSTPIGGEDAAKKIAREMNSRKQANETTEKMTSEAGIGGRHRPGLRRLRRKDEIENLLNEAEQHMQSAIDVLSKLERLGTIVPGPFSGQIRVYTKPWLQRFIDDGGQPGSLVTLQRILDDAGDEEEESE